MFTQTIGKFFVTIVCSLTLFINAKNRHVSKPLNSMNEVRIQSKSSGALRFLYKTRLGRCCRKALNTGWLNRAAGRYCDSRLSKRHIAPFIKKYHINMEESEKSLHEFTSFNDFFTRTLKKDARPIDPDIFHITSPADGTILVMENITLNDTPFVIKQARFNLIQFLGNPELAQQYEGGTLVVIRLAPHDYHHFHFPLDCTPSPAHRINGIYESVDPLVYSNGIQPLQHNERRLYLLESVQAGTVAMMSVGALCVGKIKETYIPQMTYRKGDQAGYFLFGGSTVVLVFKPGTITINDSIKQASMVGIETPIKMGAKFGSLNQLERFKQDITLNLNI